MIFSFIPADVIFIMSMITSFGALVYFGLQFNERQTSALPKWLLAFPMFAASLAARGFTLAVFLKETSNNKSEWLGMIIVLILYYGINVAIFKLCRQDLVRSFLFGFSSTLIPAGYNNDEVFYQKPHQPIADSNQYTANEAQHDLNASSVSPQVNIIFYKNVLTMKYDSMLKLILCFLKKNPLLFCLLPSFPSSTFLPQLSFLNFPASAFFSLKFLSHTFLLPTFALVFSSIFFTSIFTLHFQMHSEQDQITLDL